MRAYYNENDPQIAAWLRELIRAQVIPDGEVDARSIDDVRPPDLRGFTHCHFFAGIGGWARALQLAGWPEDRAVWTGSCPCQPLSNAGRYGLGSADPRHLWPAWFRLIAECRPPTVFGEQVASPRGLAWLDAVSHDLENAGYAIGSVDLCAPCVGAYDIRQRLWFVGHAHDTGPQRWTGAGVPQRARQLSARASGVAGGFWDEADWLPCRDGKQRAVEPGTFPLVARIPARLGRLRGYGNAIKPQVAAELVRAYIEIGG